MKRFGAFLLSAAFLFAVNTAAAGLRHCPHHDAVATPHASHHATHAATETAPAPDHHNGACTCIAGAQCAVAIALPAAPVASFTPASSVMLVPVARLAHQAPARSPRLFLPEATAPPVVL